MVKGAPAVRDAITALVTLVAVGPGNALHPTQPPPRG